MIIPILFIVIIVVIIILLILTIINFRRVTQIQDAIKVKSISASPIPSVDVKSIKLGTGEIKVDDDGNIIINDYLKIGKNDGTKYIEIYKNNGKTNIRTETGLVLDVGKNNIQINADRISGLF